MPDREYCLATRGWGLLGDVEFVKCVCGNDEMGAGLWPANVYEDGTGEWASTSDKSHIKPDAPLWSQRYVGCLECGRVIDLVQGQRVNAGERHEDYPVKVRVVSNVRLDFSAWDGEWLG